MSRDEFGRLLKHPRNGGGSSMRDDGDQDNDRRSFHDDRRSNNRFEQDRRHDGRRDYDDDRRPGRYDNDERDHNNRDRRNDDRKSYGDDSHYGPAGDTPLHDKDGLFPGRVIQGQVCRVESYGAFVEFDDPHNERRRLRGLVHISQMASHRVENVTEIVNLKDQVYAVVLSVEEGRQLRIRLSLKDVNQETGKYSGRDLDSQPRYERRGGGGRNGPPPQRRAKDRREMYLSCHVNWREGSEALRKHRDAPPYLRALWSASPEPPSRSNAEVSKKKEKVKEESSQDSDSSSESSASSSYDRRKIRDRKRSRDKRDRRRRQERSRGRSRRSRRSKRRDSNSSESSSSDSSSSSSSSSRSGSGSRSSSPTSLSAKSPPTKKEKPNPPPEKEVPAENWTESDLKNAQDLKSVVQSKEAGSDEEEGPMPLPQSNAAGGAASQGNSAYGKALLPGEGQAIAQYVQQNLRIPRRGEIGYSGDDVDMFENSGYVMSGSRHKRMNAVRIRKENQVYSAEEQRALALITMEENQQKEAQLMEDFKVMLKEKQRARNKAKSLK